MNTHEENLLNEHERKIERKKILDNIFVLSKQFERLSGNLNTQEEQLIVHIRKPNESPKNIVCTNQIAMHGFSILLSNRAFQKDTDNN